MAIHVQHSCESHGDLSSLAGIVPFTGGTPRNDCLHAENHPKGRTASKGMVFLPFREILSNKSRYFAGLMDISLCWSRLYLHGSEDHMQCYKALLLKILS